MENTKKYLRKIIFEETQAVLAELGMHDAGANVAHIGQKPDELDAQKVDPEDIIKGLKKILTPFAAAVLSAIKAIGTTIDVVFDVLGGALHTIAVSVIRNFSDSTWAKMTDMAMLLLGGAGGAAGISLAFGSALAPVGLLILGAAGVMGGIAGGIGLAHVIGTALREYAKTKSRKAAEKIIKKSLKNGTMSFKEATKKYMEADVLDQHTPVGGSIKPGQGVPRTRHGVYTSADSVSSVKAPRGWTDK